MDHFSRYVLIAAILNTSGGCIRCPRPPLPASTPPEPLVEGASFYPRAIRLANGNVLATVVAPQASGRLGATVVESRDDGLHFDIVGHVDDPRAQGGLCCGTLFQLPKALGTLPVGALLWSASLGLEIQDEPMSIPIWKSTDEGRTWTYLSTVTSAAVPRRRGGIWEPEFSMLDDGTLVTNYSDETDSAHSQKLVESRSADGAQWESPTPVVAIGRWSARPGMANVRRTAAGFAMTYEICGAGYECATHIRFSPDGWNWGDPNDAGLRPQTVDGRQFRHAPTVVWNDSPGKNGRLYLIGQMLYDRNGQVAPENGTWLFANSEGGQQFWWAIKAPVPVPDPYDNFCPNYSSTIVALEQGTVALEIASRYDGPTCRSYFARRPLRGSEVNDGLKYRLVNVQSGLCLDVAGGSTSAGGKVQQWTCNELPPQNWTARRAPDGTFSLQAEISGMCLTASDSSTAAGANVEQQLCDRDSAQVWSIRSVGDGTYSLAHAGLCLDVAGGSTEPGGTVQQWLCNDLSPQIWHFERR